MYAGLAMVALLGLAMDVPATTLEELQQQLVQVERGKDLDATMDFVHRLQSYVATDPSVPAYLALGRAALHAAELMRWDYEEGENTMDPRDRRLLGRDIDDVANIGHDALSHVPDNLSEKWRIEADLWATMIRSSYKGNKYGDNMERAYEKALELDPNNANALITASKRPLFAEPQHGGDVPKALEMLNKAIAIDPDNDRALAFRGAAYEKLGNMPKAMADWKKALELNPNNQLAAKKLNEYGDKSAS